MNRYLLSIMKGQQKGLIAQCIIFLLLPLTLFYRLGIFCHRTFYRLIGAAKSPKPVISIGNITLGGSGKTPLVIWLARKLQEKDIKAVILIRGHMPVGSSKASDEVDMVNEQVPFIPVLSGPDRVANIRKSNGSPGDVYIADDAFQHWPLQRDLDIVVIDTLNPFGNGYLLPAGILREGLSSLKRADIVVLTKTDSAGDTRSLYAKLKAINPQALIVESRYKSDGAVDVFNAVTLPESFLKEKGVVGFCAIGNPLSFELSLKNSGAKISGFFSFMDHHVYQTRDIERMVEYCHHQKVEVLVTTHKDAVKLRNFNDLFAGLRLVYMPIQLEITQGSDEFIHQVIAVCRH
jgi:tetraacyldisaccharide 4'-kinase